MLPLLHRSPPCAASPCAASPCAASPRAPVAARRLGLGLALGLLGAGGAGPLAAQAADSIRAAWRLPAATRYEPPPPPWIRPSATVLSPSAFGAEWGDFYGGIGYQQRARFVEASDGMAAAGFGLGNARRLVGLEVTTFSFSTQRSGWGNRVGADIKLHRLVTRSVAVAVGWEGYVRGYEFESRYATVSMYRPLRRGSTSPWFSDVLLTAGLGDGRFLPEERAVNRERGINAFGSLSLRVAPPAAVIVDWTGQDLVTALSLTPLRRVPFVVTVGVADLLGTAGDGARLTASAGLGVRFCRLAGC
jgi:hypothetical protein